MPESAFKSNGGMASDVVCTMRFADGLEIEFTGWVNLCARRNYLPAGVPDPQWLEFEGASTKGIPMTMRKDGRVIPIENFAKLLPLPNPET